MNPLRLDIQGGKEYLPFAKKKLRELKASMKERGISSDNRHIKLEGATIFVQSISYGDARIQSGGTRTGGGGFGNGSGDGSGDGSGGSNTGIIVDHNSTGHIRGGGGGGGNTDIFGVIPISPVGGGFFGRVGWRNSDPESAAGAYSGLITDNAGVDTTGRVYAKTTGGMDLIRIRALKKPFTLILIHIATTTDPFDTLGKDEYRVLTYQIITNQGSTIQLKPAEIKLKQLKIEDKGQNLVIQSSPREILATLPSIFSFNPLIDNTDAMERTWAAVDNLFGRKRLIGSAVAMMPTHTTATTGTGTPPTGAAGKAGLEYSYNARCNYILDPRDNTKVLSRDFRWKPTFLGFGLFYVGLMPYNGGRGRARNRWHIQYRDTTNGPWKLGGLIGEDYETPNPFADGYSWKFHVPIAALSPTQALVKTVRKEQTYSIFGARVVTIDIEIGILRRCSDEKRTGTFPFLCERGLTSYYEDLHMGSVPIEELTYQEHAEKYPTIFIEHWMVKHIVAQKAWCGDWPNYLVGFLADLKISGSAGIALPPLRMYYDGKTIHPAYAEGHFRSQNKGTRELHVLMYDNINADETFIVFYTYTELNVTAEGYYEPGVMIVHQSTNSANTYYKMAYRLKGGGVTKVVLTSGTNSINAVSCQIYKGLIAYTYRLYENNIFKHRVIGIINIASGQRDEFLSYDDEPQLAGFPLSGLAAIGMA
ncbi:hypothetical protein MBAV_003982 [Candidatus Magnetobacterium bavaricum]|uniref:Uncharacterized protein n=1 Tax=Candidatus Magnetobacterium bavaricum TaxID=29290 RepID=A0A0F3GPU2_9BACT|nr:hypothetical protein MBAV_003982 [Candidatus Magnetobacterium bavaricum]